MHSYNQKSQSDECLICHAPLLKQISLAHLLCPLSLCQNCLSQFHVLDIQTTFHHYPLRILYEYNEFFRTLLYQYKGLYDYALKDAFLCTYLSKFKTQYDEYLIAVAPSSSFENEKRGFAPMETIAYTFSQHVFTGLYKKEAYKQSGLSFEERKNVVHKIGIHHPEELQGKKVLIFDDVVTSSSTLTACLSLIKTGHPQCIELLVLSTKSFQTI